MIDKIKIENLTVFEDLEINTNYPINVFIGENGTGKTQILKFIYLACFGTIIFLDSKTNPPFPYSKKFFRGSGNELVRNDEIANASFKIFSNTEEIAGYSINKNREIFGSSSTKLDEIREKLVFIPEKDMLTHAKGLPEFFRKYKIEFDQTYIDIIEKAKMPELREIPVIAKNNLATLEDIMDGIVEIHNDRFYIKKRDGRMVSFDFEAEGIKKIGLLWLLLMNESITEGTILLWDEPETNINPKITSVIANLLLDLSRNGVQIFLTTHNYFLAEYLDVLEHEENECIFHSLYRTENNGVKCESNATFSKLSHNLIVEEHINLYDAEIEKVMG